MANYAAVNKKLWLISPLWGSQGAATSWQHRSRAALHLHWPILAIRRRPSDVSKLCSTVHQYLWKTYKPAVCACVSTVTSVCVCVVSLLLASTVLWPRTTAISSAVPYLGVLQQRGSFSQVKLPPIASPEQIEICFSQHLLFYASAIRRRHRLPPHSASIEQLLASQALPFSLLFGADH